MNFTYQEAMLAIYEIFRVAWTTTGNKVQYPDVDDPSWVEPSNTESWARVTIEHVDGRLKTLSSGNGNSLYSREGIFCAQIFTPAGNALQESYNLAKVISDAYEMDKTSGIWFRNVSLREVGKSGLWQQSNVTAIFHYTELK